MLLSSLIILLFFPLDGHTKVKWKRLAKKDLKAIHHILEAHHPGPKDSENLTFDQLLHQNLKTHLRESVAVTTPSEYFFLLKSFVNGFQDAHLGLMPAKTFKRYYQWQGRDRWPGFVVGYVNQKFMVIETQNNLQDIQKGWEVKQCNGLSMHAYLDLYVLPYQGIKNIGSQIYRVTPYAFVDKGNPYVVLPQRCVFFDGAKRIPKAIEWFPIQDQEVFSMAFQKAAHRPVFKEKYNLYKIDEGQYWVQITSLAPKGEIHKLKKIIQALSGLRSADLVVLDLRGNGGGNSLWGQKIVSSLLGSEYVKRVQEGLPRHSVDFRASKKNLRHWEGVVKELKEKFGETSSASLEFQKVVSEMKKALRYKEPFAQLRSSPRRASYKTPWLRQAHAFSGKLIVFTGPYCASACLGMMDLLKPAQNMVHVGLPTSADTLYMDNRSETLPSKMMAFHFATKVYRNRLRKAYQGYAPDVRWEGMLGDTELIQGWIMAHAHQWSVALER